MSSNNPAEGAVSQGPSGRDPTRRDPPHRAIELKGGLYTFMSLRLRTDELDAIDAALADKVQQAPAFFENTPVVVDLDDLDPEGTALDGAALLACIRRHRLVPIAATLRDKSSPLAESIALPLMEGNARRKDTRAARDGKASGEGAKGEEGGGAEAGERRTEPAEGRTANGAGGSGLPEEIGREIEYVVRTPMLVDRPVRSGQQIYARDTDLIVMGQVGPGAEVIADNNIHVYGPLRGRALCGVSGNTDARIFCQSLEAELVSVAGTYRMLETIPESLRGKPAQVWLDDERLNIEPL